MSENLEHFEDLKEKKVKIQPFTQPKSWLGALDHLAIGLVDNKYTKLGKIGEKMFLILGLANINLSL